MTITHHPNGVIVNGKLYHRDEFYAADHISLREWLALGVVILGILLWVVTLAVGVVWLVRRWL